MGWSIPPLFSLATIGARVAASRSKTNHLPGTRLRPSLIAKQTRIIHRRTETGRRDADGHIAIRERLGDAPSEVGTSLFDVTEDPDLKSSVGRWTSKPAQSKRGHCECGAPNYRRTLEGRLAFGPEAQFTAVLQCNDGFPTSRWPLLSAFACWRMPAYFSI